MLVPFVFLSVALGLVSGVATWLTTGSPLLGIAGYVGAGSAAFAFGLVIAFIAEGRRERTDARREMLGSPRVCPAE